MEGLLTTNINILSSTAPVGAAGETEEPGDGETDRYDYKYLLNRDKRRWAKADQDGDGLLNKAEFSDFLHPEEVEHMKDVVIDVSMETRSLIGLYSRHNRSLCFHGQTELFCSESYCTSI